MRIFNTNCTHRRHCAAYTLVEIVVATALYLTVMVAAVVSIQIFALRIYTLGATKITATQGTRKALNQIRDDIRQGKVLLVGNADNSGHFTACSGTNGAVGNALMVYYTNAMTAPYSIYYLQTNTVSGVSSNNLLWLSMVGSASNIVKLSTFITNMDVFDTEYYPTTSLSATLTISNNPDNNQLFGVKLQYYQWEYPVARVGTNGGDGSVYDYYQVRTKVCRRALD